MQLRTVIIFCLYLATSMDCFSQKWPVPIHLPQYGRYIELSDSVNLNDTIHILIGDSKSLLFKFVFFDSKGKSFCEVYKQGNLYEKGYYENSLDTLKMYSSNARKGGLRGKIKVFEYFEPLKDGEWLETVKGRLRKRVYKNGARIK